MAFKWPSSWKRQSSNSSNQQNELQLWMMKQEMQNQARQEQMTAQQEMSQQSALEREQMKNEFAVQRMSLQDTIRKQAEQRRLEQKAPLTRIGKVEDINLKREMLRKDLENFFEVDRKIPRGEGMGRFIEGAKSSFESISQSTLRGQMSATRDALAKRLRVQLVRAAGDVGNINIVEQEAAEKIIPLLSDSKQVAELKRAFLKEFARAVDDNNESEVRKVLREFMTSSVYKGPQMQEPNSSQNGVSTTQASMFEDSSEDREREMAIQAIQAGKDARRIKALYKQRTGRDL